MALAFHAVTHGVGESRATHPLEELAKLKVEPEGDRCGHRKYEQYIDIFRRYEEDHGLLRRIEINQGGLFSPYTNRWFDEESEVDREHIVARKEAFESGLCIQGSQTMRSYITDLTVLTIAGKRENEVVKGDKDAAEFMPPEQTCWFAARVVRIKRLYALSVDPAEESALRSQLTGCQSFDLRRPVR